MKFKSTLLGQTSGALDATVFSHNRGGRYTRVRAIPTNPNTPQQQVIRGAVSQLTSLWNDVLTADQRDAWDVYSFNVPLLDRLGEPRNAGGLGMYVRSNVPRIQVSLVRVDDAPTVFDLGAYFIPSVVNASEATQQMDVAFSALDLWTLEDDSAMLFYTSRPQNLTINFFKGPYRFAGRITGNAAVPPVPPLPIASSFTFVAGQRLFIRLNVTRADGRLGAEARVAVDTIA